MNRKLIASTTLAIAALGALGVAAVKAQQPAPPPGPTAPAPTVVAFEMKGQAGRSLGFARVFQGQVASPSGVVLHFELTGLAPGWHGMHFHAVGDCSAADYTSAGAHVHTTEPVIHGFYSERANDWGDLPNIYVGADGTAHVEVFSPYVVINPVNGDRRPALLDADGSALIIHANQDDYRTQPIGGAGARIACGVMKK